MTATTQSGLRISGDRCMPFEGGRRKNGYGYAQFMGQQYLAHRLAYALNELLHPAALKGVVIRHRCDNPICINVEHLELGTTQDNVDDKVQRGRHPRGEACSFARLTAVDVAEIRRIYIPRDRTTGQRALARRFQVSQSTISYVLSGRNWSSVTKKEPQ